MELDVGATYNSPIHGRYVQVIDIERETSEFYILSVFWVDKDSFDTELGNLKVQKSDVGSWTRVEL